MQYFNNLRFILTVNWPALIADVPPDAYNLSLKTVLCGTKLRIMFAVDLPNVYQHESYNTVEMHVCHETSNIFNNLKTVRCYIIRTNLFIFHLLIGYF